MGTPAFRNCQWKRVLENKVNRIWTSVWKDRRSFPKQGKNRIQEGESINTADSHAKVDLRILG